MRGTFSFSLRLASFLTSHADFLTGRGLEKRLTQPGASSVVHQMGGVKNKCYSPRVMNSLTLYILIFHIPRSTYYHI